MTNHTSKIKKGEERSVKPQLVYHNSNTDKMQMVFVWR
jgi:hypothetical protein